jgi:hypothetical protein
MAAAAAEQSPVGSGADTDAESRKVARSEKRFLKLEKSDNQGLSRILPDLWIGSVIDAYDEGQLRAAGITHVVNCGAMEFPTRTSLPHCDLKFCDAESERLADVLPTAFAFLENVQQEAVMGKSRSVSVCMAWLMHHHRMTLRHAYETIAERRSIGPNDGFIRQLMELEVTYFQLESSAASTLAPIWVFGLSTQPRKVRKRAKPKPKPLPQQNEEERRQAQEWVTAQLEAAAASIDWFPDQPKLLYIQVSQLLLSEYSSNADSCPFSIEVIRTVFPALLRQMQAQRSAQEEDDQNSLPVLIKMQPS